MKFKTCLSTPIGYLTIEGSHSYVEAVLFTDEKSSVSKKLPPLAKETVSQLKEYFEGKREEFSIPVLQTGTIFQQQVWNQLISIPYGSTYSYLKIAQQIGNIKSTRAIGNANSKNAISILVPCHRVIGASGKLVGYAGGLWRKDWLLNHEARIANGVQTLF